MNLFHREIQDVCSLFEPQEKRELPITDRLPEDLGKNNMVFSDQSAFELGGGTCSSVSFDLPGAEEGLIDSDKIVLIGRDLNELQSDVSFARITLLDIADDGLKGDALYDRLEKIRFTKYRVNPEGYMLRTASGNREKVRVSKSCAKQYGFSEIGSCYMQAYHQLPFVKKVMIFFVTGEDELVKPLAEIGERKRQITDAIDHILKGMAVNDCNACSVKDLCDQVEGMRELHGRQPK